MSLGNVWMEEETQEVCPWLEEICQGWEVAKINKALVEAANNLNLGVDEVDIEELLEVVPEELTKEELLDLEQECVAEEEARGERTGEEKKNTPQENSEWRV